MIFATAVSFEIIRSECAHHRSPPIIISSLFYNIISLATFQYKILDQRSSQFMEEFGHSFIYSLIIATSMARSHHNQFQEDCL